ncbi:hypothetical protein E4U53_005509 [Claviceps sorghi]|nr:hypothetical protein E4U53_005509 [Claviceps sorghi]
MRVRRLAVLGRLRRIPIRHAALAGAIPPGVAAVQLHPVPSKQVLLVKVVPPTSPAMIRTWSMCPAISAFIPDAGMIGTVLVHAVANLQATFATDASLSLDYSPLIQVQEVGETTVVKQLLGEISTESSTPVELASGRMVPIRRLRRGVKVRTPTGVRKVAVVLRTAAQHERLCRVGGGLLVTPWHPVSLDDGGKTWDFPAMLTHETVRYTGYVYSVMLQTRRQLGVALGHGLTTGNDARAHGFPGDYSRVSKSLARLGTDKSGVVQTRGFARDGNTSGGLVCGLVCGPVCGFKPWLAA